MILDIFKTKSDLLKQINLLKDQVKANKNLVKRFIDLYEDKTIPTRIAKRFLKNLKLKLNEIK